MIRDRAASCSLKGYGNSETIDEFLIYAHSIESIYFHLFAKQQQQAAKSVKTLVRAMIQQQNPPAQKTVRFR
jgi:hypothetical protein